MAIRPRHIEILKFLSDGTPKTHHQIAETIYTDIKFIHAAYSVCKTLCTNGLVSINRAGRKSEITITTEGINILNPEGASTKATTENQDTIQSCSDKDLFKELNRRGYSLQITHVK
jgi:hypothetical protein